jgi:hypothetical protein
MDREAYERRQRQIAEHAANEGANYFDPDSPTIWKRYIIGPVTRWRRVLWWFFPASHAKMRRIMRPQSDQIWRDATDHLTGSKTPTAIAMVRVFILGMLGPVIFSALGPIYYGYTRGPYWLIVVWALTCTVGCLWQYRSSLKSALATAPPSFIGRTFVVVTILATMAAAFIVGDSLIYLIVGLFARR